MRDSRLRQPKYMSWVIDTRGWPSWSAIMRAVAPASSNAVAVVRQAWIDVNAYANRLDLSDEPLPPDEPNLTTDGAG